jgi:hypothetical protein
VGGDPDRTQEVNVSAPQPDPSPKRQYSTAGTAALLIIGLLFLIPSGLCTGVFGGGALLDAFTSPHNASDALSMLLIALLFGGPFIAVGGVMVWIAVKRLRGR